jgi:hypothetical protein
MAKFAYYTSVFVIIYGINVYGLLYNVYMHTWYNSLSAFDVKRIIPVFWGQ